jgi:hypothetical protein
MRWKGTLLGPEQTPGPQFKHRAPTPAPELKAAAALQVMTQALTMQQQTAVTQSPPAPLQTAEQRRAAARRKARTQGRRRRRG